MMRRGFRITFAAAVAAVLLAGAAAQADVRLPHIFGSHMVLQRDRPLPVWGWADAGEKVDVTLADRPVVSTTAGPDGAWKVTLPAMQAGGPVKMSVKGKNEVVFDDVLIGEVWVCSGQSNMQMTVGGCINAGQEIAAANYPKIRHIAVANVFKDYPADDIGGGEWQVCAPNVVGGFTAAGYFMARELFKQLNVPVGLVNSSWGGTCIETWIAPEGYAAVPSLDGFTQRIAARDPKGAGYKQAAGDYLKAVDGWITQAKGALAADKPIGVPPGLSDPLKPYTDPQQTAALYNGMIHPIIPYAIRGAIWYQGESNHGERASYTDKMTALIGGWRKLWNQGDFPFYYVQIAPYSYGTEDPSVEANFWEAQAAAQAIPGTGMVRTNDIGDINDIHPKNKQEVGRRLALQALAKIYGRKDVVCEGPTFKSITAEGNKLRVRFSNAEGGLASSDGKPLTWFEVAGADTDFVKADAVIDGDSVVVSSPEAPQPVAVHFAWNKDAEPNLVNAAGLPAFPFRKGTFKYVDLLAARVPEVKDYKLIYQLDLAKLEPNPPFDINHAAEFKGQFDRIAYFLELQKPDESVKYVYVSMDAFTDDLSKIAIPTVASKAFFQMNVANMNVLSNVKEIVTGNGLSGGNIAFWPNNYGPANSANVPNASSEFWDFGDQPSDPVDGYGCMQVHNHDAKQTIFAVNNWKARGSADIGIGNSNTNPQTRNWTFSGNAGSYEVKKLRIFVRPKG